MICIARKSFYDEDLSVYLYGQAPLLLLIVNCRLPSYSVKDMARCKQRLGRTKSDSCPMMAVK